MARDWGISDAWFLGALALAMQWGAGTLTEVIEYGDFLNHAIFSANEIEQAVGRLRSAGLLIIEGKRFCLTIEASTLWTSFPSQFPFERFRSMRAVLRTSYEFDPSSRWSLEHDVWQQAYVAYRERFTARRRS